MVEIRVSAFSLSKIPTPLLSISVTVSAFTARESLPYHLYEPTTKVTVHSTQMGSSTPAFPDEGALREGKLQTQETNVIKYGNCIVAGSKRKKNLEDSQCEPLIKRRVSKRGKVQGKETDNDLNFEATNPKMTRLRSLRCRNKYGAVKADTSNHDAADVIDVDDYNEMGALLTEDCPINLSKTKVGKYMQDANKDGYNLLGEYLRKTGNGVPLWECEITAVYKKDIVSLLQDSPVRSNVIDAFTTILGRKQAANNERKTLSHFMPSYCWDFIKAGKYDRLRLMLYDKLLKNLGRADFIFFPLAHKHQYHFTLLILKTRERTWHHYNPLLRRGGAKRDPCFVEAKELHKEVSDFMKFNKAIAEQVLSTTMVRREFVGHGNPFSVSVPLRDDEKEAFQFLKNAEVQYPLVPSPVCPQQHETSLDCGVAVMYFMEHVSEGWVMDNQFEFGAMTKWRARVISCFLNGPTNLEIDDPEPKSGIYEKFEHDCMSTQLDETSVDILEDFPAVSCPLPRKRKKTSSISKAEVTVNLQNGVPHLESEIESKDDLLAQENGGGSSSTQRFRNGTHEVLGGMLTLNTCEKAIALESRAIAIQTENPEFKVVMLPCSIQEDFLSFPHEFAKSHLKQPAGNVILGVSNGTRTWSVEFKTEKSRALFLSGWLAFVRDNNLNDGDVCVFSLINKRKILFEVVFFRNIEAENRSLLPGEADLPIQIKDDLPIQIKDDLPVQIKDDFPIQTEGDLSIPIEDDLPIPIEDGGGSSSTPRFQKRTQEVLGRMHTLTMSEKAIALERGAIAFQSENPYFMVVMQPSYIKQSFLHFPREFAKRYLKLPAGNVILGVSNGTRTWSVKFESEKSRAQFKAGWLAFARDNNLEVGDVCAFSLINNIKLLFEVVFFRTKEDASLPLVTREDRP